ncbi:ubiquitin-conjugating enzyme E2 U-like [Dysidea avara]|uniref:ubiquitin-conjugating enzyme E2 U-like n=1 Tax=Dysidea avara TaxID=196820 RepID=UPI0033197F47
MIHSRAFLLLRKELILFQQQQQERGISVSLVEDDMFLWNATIKLVEESVWKGGIFEALIHFNGEYNEVAPKVQFLTIPFHPNVDAKTGEAYLRIVHYWCGEYTASQLLLSIQDLFGDPDLRDVAVLNKDAAKMLQFSPFTYKQMALDCVAASLRIQSGKAPYGDKINKEVESIAVSYKPIEESSDLHAKPISFADYQTYWKGIATSVADVDGSTILQTGFNTDIASKEEETTLEHQAVVFQDMLHRYHSLKYGIIRSRNHPTKPKSARKQRAEHMDQLKMLYHRETGHDHSTKLSTPKDKDTNTDIQQLLDWTQQLDPDAIDSDAII